MQYNKRTDGSKKGRVMHIATVSKQESPSKLQTHTQSKEMEKSVQKYLPN
jgi:hypothetical protein